MAQWDLVCPGCFRDKGRVSRCPNCGFDEMARRSPSMLPYRTPIGSQYITGKLLGKPGGFGITYLGYDTILNTKVAIKEFFPRELVSRSANGVMVQMHSEEDRAVFEFSMDRFLHEARTLVRIDHPNVVRVRNYLEANGTAYIIMSYYEGCTLSEYLERSGGRLTEQDALTYLKPIFSGLQEVHRKGFLHRDIKPGNIYLTNDGKPILLDFGAARSAVKDQSRGLSVVLSPGFAPSEQYHRSGEQGPWTDVYGCAATLYYVLTGQLPPEATELLTKNDQTAIENALSQVSPNVRKAIMAGMAVQPKDRPQTISAFEAMLEGAPLPFTEQKTVVKKTETVQKEPLSSLAPAMPMTIQAELPSSAPSLNTRPPMLNTEGWTHQMDKKWDWTTLAVFFAGVLMALIALAVYFYKTNQPTQLIVAANGQGDYRTISEAIDVATEGIKIFVEPGTYKESLILDNTIEIIARKEKGDVLIEATQSHAVHVKSGTPILRGFKIRSLGKQGSNSHAVYITGGTPTIESCDLSATQGAVVQVSGRDTNPVLRKLTVHHSAKDAISFDQDAQGVLEDSELTESQGWGITVLGAKNPKIQRVKVLSSVEGGIYIANAEATLMEVEVANSKKPGIQISKNANPTLLNVDVHDGLQNGIFISENSKAKIEKSQIYRNAFAGIAVRDNSEPQITDTKIFEGKDTGVWFYEGAKGKLSNVEVYNNEKHGIQVSTKADPQIIRSKIYGGKQYGILFEENAKGLMDESEVYGNEKMGIVIKDASDPLIKRSKIYDGREGGILISKNGKGTIEFSQVFRNAFQNVHIEKGATPTIRSSDIYDGQGGGVWVTENGTGLIENSNIYNNAKFGVGIEKQGDPTVRKCKIYGGHSHGVWISVGGRGTIQENQIYGNAEYGVYINPNTAPSLVNNTINSNGQGDTLDLGF